MKMTFGCDFAKCVTGGDGFEKGVIYPILSYNNGVHVLRMGNASKGEEPVDFIFGCGGNGEGLINPYDGSGKPSFELFRIRNAKGKPVY